MKFCNINFNLKNKTSLFERDDDRKMKIIITANAAFIVEANTTERFYEILNSNHVTFDGEIPLRTANFLSWLRLIP